MEKPYPTLDPNPAEDAETAAKRAAIRDGFADIDAGRVVPHEVVRRWLLSWGTENELPPPQLP